MQSAGPAAAIYTQAPNQNHTHVQIQVVALLLCAQLSYARVPSGMQATVLSMRQLPSIAPYLQAADDARMSMRHALAEMADLPGACPAGGVLEVNVLSHLHLHKDMRGCQWPSTTRLYSQTRPLLGGNKHLQCHTTTSGLLSWAGRQGPTWGT